ncbi:MmcQ/YjbR family DNA-binding protein [Streptomyces sp. NPDC050703]|uniref:MmcQ/YjbR family DNA-binding protein n=1 Tax=Streptomyces sp. NPDC050703 TaxID=3157218 RepID=UPI0034186E91
MPKTRSRGRTAHVTSDDVRRVALALPDTVEKTAWSMPTFRVSGKMFVTVPDDETSIAVRCPKVERDELVLAEPEKFWVAAHEAGSAWVRVRLAELDEEELTDILADSWRQAAPPRLLEEHPELGVLPGAE